MNADDVNESIRLLLWLNMFQPTNFFSRIESELKEMRSVENEWVVHRSLSRGLVIVNPNNH